MSKEQNIAVQALGGQLLASGDFDRLGEVFAADVVDHDPSPGQAAGVEGVKQFWREFKASFPDFALEVDVLTASDDYVTIVYRIASTHEGTYMGAAGSGKHFEARGVQVAKFEGGLITDRWGSSDSLGVVAQLGIAVPAHAATAP